MQTVIFLGAGASKADGAPLQKDLFSVYFQMIRRRHPVDEMEHELMDYFDLVFGLDCRHADPAALSFPTFEEAIGIVDLALARGESLREFSILNRATNSNRLGFIRLYLILMLASVLHARLDGQNVHHRRLIRKLRRMKRLDTTAFVSTNYDILIDNALMEAYPHRTLDYGIDFANFDKPDDWVRPGRRSLQLLKLHGSLNWLACSTCGTLTLTPKEKGVIRLLTRLDESYCPDCETIYQPVIVPPSYQKDLSTVYLQNVWNRADRTLRQAEHIIFCGYSFPDADIHVKYLLKRALTTAVRPVRISVVNHYDGKSAEEETAENQRYNRFLGQVEFLRISFEQFARNPLSVME